MLDLIAMASSVLSSPGMFDDKSKHAIVVFRRYKCVPGRGGEGFKVLLRARVCRENLERVTSVELTHGFFCFEDRKWTGQALSVEKFVSHGRIACKFGMGTLGQRGRWTPVRCLALRSISHILENWPHVGSTRGWNRLRVPDQAGTQEAAIQ